MVDNSENSGNQDKSDNANNGQVASQETSQVQNQNDPPEPPPQPRMGFLDVTKSLILRALVIYFITIFFRKPATTTDSNVTHPARPPAINIFDNGTYMDLYVFLSEKEVFRDYDDPKALIWKHHGLTYGDWESGEFKDGTHSIETSFPISDHLRNNGSLYLHVYLIKKDSISIKAGKEKFTGHNVAYGSKQLIKYKKLKLIKTSNLLTGESVMSPEEIEEVEKTNQALVSHWHPNITVNLVTDQTNWIQGSVPSPLNEFIEFTPTGDFYKPVVFFNEFWNLLRDYHPINDTVKVLDLRITYQPLSLFKWQMYCAHSVRSRFTSNLFQEETDDEDQDSLKEALLETSPYLLAATIIVSILHSVFELLAFKNDIQFWNNRKSLEGLSVRLVFFNVFQSLVVLLYVLDNDANTLIRISCFGGLAIEIWKINKVVDISLDRENKILGLIPRPQFKDKGSYAESSTKQYDQLAFKYLSWVLFPLLAMYAIYSLIYLQHKGWYSWVLNMIYSFLLTFGFIMMTPQLFINYKLKSVAHLPWRMMSYKCLNTFIDDIFAFVIKMPTMYRLGCFRDDIVFFIFLYQRWIYKTDPTRLNEFGFSAEMEAEHSAQNVTPAIKGDQEKKDD